MSRPVRRVVITGMGVVSPNGVGRDAFARACIEGRSGLSRPALDTTGLKTTSVAQVLPDAWTAQGVMETPELRRVPRMVPIAARFSLSLGAGAGAAGVGLM